MTGDWKQQLSHIKQNLIVEALASKNYQAVLDGIGEVPSKENKEVYAYCHFQLSKADSIAGNFGDARFHARQVELAKPESHSIRVLNSERLKLLVSPVAPVPVPLAFNPSSVDIHGFGQVLVLGKYETWGHHGELTKSVLLLKKEPHEFDQERDIRADVASGLGFHMLRLLKGFEFAKLIDLIVPIPASPERYVLRRFHAPSEIAKVLSKSAAIPMMTDLLLKIKDTESLRGLGKYDRAKEITGTMALSKKQPALEGATVLLIDDVVTYGTNFREAKKVLIAGGAREVYAMALAAAHGLE